MRGLSATHNSAANRAAPSSTRSCALPVLPPYFALTSTPQPITSDVGLPGSYRMRPAFSFVDEEIRAYTSVPDCECLTCASKWRDGSTYQQYVPCPAMSVWLAHACDRNAHL